MTAFENMLAAGLDRVAREGFRCSEGHLGKLSCEYCRAGLAEALTVVLAQDSLSGPAATPTEPPTRAR